MALPVGAHWLRQLLGQDVEAQSCRYSWFGPSNPVSSDTHPQHTSSLLTLVVPSLWSIEAVRGPWSPTLTCHLFPLYAKSVLPPLLGISRTYFLLFFSKSNLLHLPRKAFLVYSHIQGGLELYTRTEVSGSYGGKKQRNKVESASNIRWSGVHGETRHPEFSYPWPVSPGEILFSHSSNEIEPSLQIVSNAMSSERTPSRNNF